MTDHVYKLTEIVGTSHKGNDAAIQAALERAQKSMRNVRWFEVVGIARLHRARMARCSIR